MAIIPRYQRFVVPVGKATVAVPPTTPNALHWIARIHLKNVSVSVACVQLYVNDGTFSDSLLPGLDKYLLAPGDVLVANGVLFPSGTFLEADATAASAIVGKIFYGEQD